VSTGSWHSAEASAKDQNVQRGHPADRFVPIRPIMRQLTPATNLVLACLAAVGLVFTLDLPWLAPTVTDPNGGDGPVEQAAFQFARVFEHVPEATSGSAALAAGARSVVTLLALTVIALALLAFHPALRGGLRDITRGVGISVPLIVLYLVFVRPGEVDGSLHWGAPVAVAVSMFLSSTLWQGALIRARRPVPAPWTAQRGGRR